MPVACDSVACDPASVDSRNFWVVPDVRNDPTVLVVPFLNCKVPAVKVKARVEPWVSASWKATVAPGAFTSMGQSIVLPLVVMVCVPDVALNCRADVPDATVIPVDNVRFPATTRVAFASVPLKPVKFTFTKLPVIETISVPAVTLTFMRLASGMPEELVKVLVPTEPEYVALTVRLPVAEKFAAVFVFQIVALFPVSVMLPVPNAMLRTLELLLLKAVHVSVLLFRSRAPLVSVNPAV